uniref:C2H2-type domain-containing protein n=1 Tax=Ditylenchus dipsaci TaxID=166011 RepID=A0A915DKR6_9BILA
MNVLQKLSRKEADRLTMCCQCEWSQFRGRTGFQQHGLHFAGFKHSRFAKSSNECWHATFSNKEYGRDEKFAQAPESPSFSKNKNINNLNLNLSPVANSSTFSFSKSPPALKPCSCHMANLPRYHSSRQCNYGRVTKNPAITTSFARTSVAQQDTAYISVQTTSNNLTTMLKAPPLICEQGPSTPASPTTPNKKRPCPLSVDALQRFDLLSPNYQPNHYMSSMDSKLSPLSISISHRDSLTTGLAGLNTGQSLSAANWAVFRDFAQAQARVNRTHSSHSDYGGEEMVDTVPNLSPLPSSLHFSFEQIQRSRSSMSNRCQSNDISNSKSPCSRRKTKHHLYRNNRHYKNKDSGSQQKSLDQEARERSRSEADMLINKCKRSLTNSNDEDEEMDDSIDQSTFSVPLRVSNSFTQHSNGGQYKKRLLQKYRSEQEKVLEKSGNKEENVNYLQLSNTSSKDQEDVGQSVSAQPSLQVSRQPTIEEPPPSPTFAELFHSRDLNKERQQQVEEWIRQQAAALETFRNSLVPLQQESNLLQVPNTTAVPLVPPNSMDHSLLNSSLHLLSPNPNQTLAPGPIKPATLWRRSRSESDVSTNQSPMPINDAAFISSRHRDRSASVNDENSKIHKCTLCPKSFGRSDMLTRHLRLHSGIKPYACQLCGQVFSRSDHLSTHQRTHTGEKPYRCPHCNYAASRRDMITRHMRTHLIDGLMNADGSPVAFTEVQAHELQIPPIGSYL